MPWWHCTPPCVAVRGSGRVRHPTWPSKCGKCTSILPAGGSSRIRSRACELSPPRAGSIWEAKCSVSELILRLCCLLQTVALSLCEGPATGLKLDEQYRQFGAVKLPLKRRRVLLGKLCIQGQPEPERFPGGNIIGCQHLPLDARAGDL